MVDLHFKYGALGALKVLIYLNIVGSYLLHFMHSYIIPNIIISGSNLIKRVFFVHSVFISSIISAGKLLVSL
jgi:hypothetical protein